jgi:hypothetical protein
MLSKINGSSKLKHVYTCTFMYVLHLNVRMCKYILVPDYQVYLIKVLYVQQSMSTSNKYDKKQRTYKYMLIPDKVWYVQQSKRYPGS